MRLTKKKVLLASLAVCLVAIVSFGTLAWFTADDTVVNEFYVGNSTTDPDKVFGIDLWEEDDLDGDGVMEAEALYSGKTYNELLAQKKRPMGSDFFTLLVDNEPGKISISGSYGDPGISYSDKLNTNVALSQYFNFNTITFNAPCAGTLTYYTRKESKKVYVVTQNGETIDTFQSVKDGAQPDANVTRVVEISSSSTVVLSTDSPTTDKGYVYAVKFSYPNLG